MRTRTFLIALSVAALLTPSAGAVLKKYEIQANIIIQGPNVTPDPDIGNRNIMRTRDRRDNVLRPVFVDCGPPGCSRALIEDDGGGSPRLLKFLAFDDRTQTTLVPALGGFIYINDASVEGPSGEFTGTGSTETNIVWGIVTGWTQTGTFWCNSAPAFGCDLSNRVVQESTEPILKSTFYDFGTWTFHGTGFTATPFVYQTFPDPSPVRGNLQWILRGRNWLTGEVPAVPLFTVALLGGSLLAMGASAIRRGRK